MRDPRGDQNCRWFRSLTLCALAAFPVAKPMTARPRSGMLRFATPRRSFACGSAMAESELTANARRRRNRAGQWGSGRNPRTRKACRRSLGNMERNRCWHRGSGCGTGFGRVLKTSCSASVWIVQRKVEGLVVSSMQKIRILAVDDHALLRKGIAALINAEPDMELVAEASNGEEAISEFRKHRPDVTLMDLHLPTMSGIECITAIRSYSPKARIVVLTTYPGDVHVLRALKAGAMGYQLKSQVNADLPGVIRAIHAGQKRISPEIANELAEHSAEDNLSPREMEVLRLVAAGNANKEIASTLVIAEDTVKCHVTNILVKLHAKDRTHAVTIALRRGIIRI